MASALVKQCLDLPLASYLSILGNLQTQIALDFIRYMIKVLHFFVLVITRQIKSLLLLYL